MTNVKTLTIILASLLIGATVTYSFNSSPEEQIEKQNKQNTKDCLSKINYGSGSSEIQTAITTCGKMELKKVVGGKLLNATGSKVPVPSKTSFDEINLGMDLEKLHDDVCNKQINSPLCKDKELFGKLYIITEQRLPGKNWFPILLGMTNAESSLGTNFARDNVGGTCTGRNNLGGAKYKINDDNTRVYESTKFGYDYKKKGKDDFNCYLFPFDSIEDYWISKVNGMRYGYKGCIDSPTPVKCLSYAYVGNPNVSEQSWINNVSIFLK